MLGVSGGIELGFLVLVLKYSIDAYSKTQERFLYCFFFALAMLALVMVIGRMMGANRRSATDFLLAGVILSQILGVVMTYLRFNMEQADLEVLQRISLYGFTANTSYEFAGRSLLTLAAIAVVMLTPFFLMRFSFNAVSLSDDESRVLGINPGAVRTAALLGATVLMTATILYCGTIGILSLVVPHICRFAFGPRFEKMLAGCVFFGAGLMVVCRMIASFIYIEGMGTFPIGPLAGILSAPLLAIALAQKRRGWE